MTLMKIADYYPDYPESVEGKDIKKFDLYTQGEDKIGSIDDVLVDQDGRFRYLVVNTGLLVFGKKVLLPIGLAQIDYDRDRVYVNSLSKEQVEQLPQYDENVVADYDYEEKVRGVYRPLAATTPATFERDTYNYDQEPYLYDIPERDRQTLRLYEERLIASKNRNKTGEVAVGKRIETDTARVSVPVEKERVVIERTTPEDIQSTHPNNVDFQEGEVARIEVFEEKAEIRKQAFVREEVNVRKEVIRDTVNAEDTVRREELDIHTEGNPAMDKSNLL